MKAILSEVGFAFNADEYAKTYGNENLLKLQRKYTIRTVDRTTKIPQVTKLYQIIKGNGFKIIEFPRFTMSELSCLLTGPTPRRPITDVDVQLPTHSKTDTINYIGQSNQNQKIVIKHIIKNLFVSPVSGVTLKLLAGCHEFNTRILMYDGTIKMVQDINVGEQIMGDDSTPRQVLNLVRGNDMMYKIINVKGESCVVNGEHILCLTYTNNFFNSIRKHTTDIWLFGLIIRESKRLLNGSIVNKPLKRTLNT